MGAKTFVVSCCLVAAVLAGEKYTSKYDNINIQEIMENESLITGYTNCILDKGKCTPEGKELKDHIQDALETGCEKCTEIQTENTKVLIDHLITKRREIWKELTDKYDSTGTYRKKYEDRARENGIIIPDD